MANTTFNGSDKTANVTLTGSNLIATASGASAWVRAVDKQATGKFYFEMKPTVWGNSNTGVGISLGTNTPSTSAVGVFAVFKSGSILINGVNSGSTLGSRVANDVIGFAVNLDTSLAWARLAPTGNWNGSATANPATGVGGLRMSGIAGTGYPGFPVAMMGANLDSITANFGDTAFSGTVPSGYTSGFTAGATPPTSLVTTQSGIEQFFTTLPNLRVTQAAIEMWATVGTTASGQFIVTQAAIEMWGPVVAAAAAERVKVWNGSAWVIKPSKVWNGSAWVAKPAKIWNGSAWE